MKINNFRGDLTDISAKKEALGLQQQGSTSHCMLHPHRFHWLADQERNFFPIYSAMCCNNAAW